MPARGNLSCCVTLRTPARSDSCWDANDVFEYGLQPLQQVWKPASYTRHSEVSMGCSCRCFSYQSSELTVGPQVGPLNTDVNRRQWLAARSLRGINHQTSYLKQATCCLFSRPFSWDGSQLGAAGRAHVPAAPLWDEASSLPPPMGHTEQHPSPHFLLAQWSFNAMKVNLSHYLLGVFGYKIAGHACCSAVVLERTKYLDRSSNKTP